MLTTARVWTVNNAAIQEHLNIQLPRGCSRRTQGDLTCFMMWINVAVKTNQRRKQDKTRSTQKKMQEPEVPAFYFICLGVPPPPDNRRGSMARWRVPDVIFFLYLSIVFYLGFPILPYALSFYWHFFLRPLHFILFF